MYRFRYRTKHKKPLNRIRHIDYSQRTLDKGFYLRENIIIFEMEDHNNNNQEYISLQEATKFCAYSQEYLALRARQGKLKSVKLGRNWATTKEWLEDYAGKVVEYNNSINNIKTKKEETIKAEAKKYSPPENLPIVRFPNLKLGLEDLRFGFAAALLLTLILDGVIFEQKSLVQGYNDLVPQIEEIAGAGDLLVKNTAQNMVDLSQGIGKLSDDFIVVTANYQDGLKLLSNVFEKYSQWLKGQASEIWFEKIAR